MKHATSSGVRRRIPRHVAIAKIFINLVWFRFHGLSLNSTSKSNYARRTMLQIMIIRKEDRDPFFSRHEKTKRYVRQFYIFTFSLVSLSKLILDEMIIQQTAWTQFSRVILLLIFPTSRGTSIITLNKMIIE